MKNILLMIILTGISCLFHSCLQEKRIQINENMDVISVDKKNDLKTLEMNELISHIEYIKLETNDAILLNSIQKIKVDSTLLFILDAKPQIVLFDKDGRFINKIGKRGSAPGEFLYIHDFCLDVERKEVIIFDYMQSKALKYHYDGTFSGEISIDNYFMSNQAEKLNDDILFNSVLPNEYMDIKYEYKICEKTDKSLKIKAEILPFIDGINSGRGIGRTAKKSISKSPNHLLFTSCFSNILYEYDGKNIIQKYYIKTTSKIANQSFFEKNKEREYYDLLEYARANNVFTGISNLVENSQYIVMGIENSKCLIWDKGKKQGLQFSTLYDADQNIYIFLADAIMANFLNGFIIINDVEFIYNNKEEIASKTQNKSLLNALDNIKEDDNPILSIIYIKDDLGKFSN